MFATENPGILEEARGTDETRGGQILFRCGKSGAKESAHERTGKHVEPPREHTNGGHARRDKKQRLEKAPAVLRERRRGRARAAPSA